MNIMVNQKKAWQTCLVIFVCAFIVRMAAVFMLAPEPWEMLGDAIDYDILARNLLSGNGYGYGADNLTSWRAPFQPFLIAGVYALFGYSRFAVYVLQALLGAVLPVAGWLLASMLWNRKAGVACACILMLYPPFLRWTPSLMSESNFLSLLSLVFLACFLSVRAGSPGRRVVFSCITGAMCAIAALCRPVALPVLGLGVVLLLMDRKDVFARRVMKACVMTIVFLAVLAPWSIRNRLVHGQTVLVSTAGGFGFWQRHNSVNEDGTVYTHPEVLAAQERILGEGRSRCRRGEDPVDVYQPVLSKGIQGYFYLMGDDGTRLIEACKGLSEPDVERQLYEWGFEAWRQDTSGNFWKSVKDGIKFWMPYDDIPGRPMALASMISVTLVLLGGVAGYAMSVRAHDDNMPFHLYLLAALLCFNMLVAVFHHEARYRLPADMIMIVYAARLFAGGSSTMLSRWKHGAAIRQ